MFINLLNRRWVEEEEVKIDPNASVIAKGSAPWYNSSWNIMYGVKNFIEVGNQASFDVGYFNASGMFQNCTGLISVDIRNLDTITVSSMRRMFQNCSSLLSLEARDILTYMVQDMSEMFAGCTSLSSLDIGTIYTGGVTDMSLMFSGCEALEKLDLSNFDTSKVTKMGSMFSRCSNLKHLDTRNFDTSKVNGGGMRYMFLNCGKLDTLHYNIKGFKSNGVAPDLSDCTALKNLYLYGTDSTSNVNNFKTAAEVPSTCTIHIVS